MARKIVSLRKAVASAGTAEKLVATTTYCDYVQISADENNANGVAIGDANVVAAAGSQVGVMLYPGNNSIIAKVDDVSSLYVDSQTNGDAVTFSYYQS